MKGNIHKTDFQEVLKLLGNKNELEYIDSNLIKLNIGYSQYITIFYNESKKSIEGYYGNYFRKNEILTVSPDFYVLNGDDVEDMAEQIEVYYQDFYSGRKTFRKGMYLETNLFPSLSEFIKESYDNYHSYDRTHSDYISHPQEEGEELIEFIYHEKRNTVTTEEIYSKRIISYANKKNFGSEKELSKLCSVVGYTVNCEDLNCYDYDSFIKTIKTYLLDSGVSPFKGLRDEVEYERGIYKIELYSI